MGYFFDGPNRVVVLTPGTTAVALADLWSRWKDWARLGNAGFAPAFDTVGGEDIDSAQGTRVPLYLFVKNGWRLRPQEANHTLTVAGGTLLVDGGGDPFVDTLGSYRVRVRYSQPAQAIGYSTTGGSAGPSAEDVAAAVAQRVVEGSMTTEQVLRVLLAVLAGKVGGAGGGLERFYGLDGATVRVESTVDAQGNRTAVALDGT